jgi:NADH dehydrogenase
LKSIEDARHIRSRLLLAFEQAEMEADPDEQQRLMTVAIVGGGPTGVEMAGAIAELCHYALAKDFRRIRPQSARIILIEAGPRILPAFPQSLSRFAMRRLERLGVLVRTGKPVDAILPDAVVVGGERIPVGCAIWSAGVVASPLARLLGAETDRSGRIAVNPDLSVPGLQGIYAIGDLARAAGPDGAPLPGLAQVAKQQGAHLGRALARSLRTGEPLPAFGYRSRGNAAIVGRHAAVFDFGRWQFKGAAAWLLWALVHVYLLVGFQNRLSVSLQWLWRYLTYERGARLITEPLHEAGVGTQRANAVAAKEQGDEP